MYTNKLFEEINIINKEFYIHASNILKKLKDYDKLDTSQQNAIEQIAKEYLKYLKGNNELIGYSDEIISFRTKLLNNYFNFINQKNYNNIFTSQSKFRSTILEEFMFILFKDYIEELKNKIKNSENLLIGNTKAYTNLFFTGKNFREFINSPEIGINYKNQDFAIYRKVEIKIGNNSELTNLPIIAIENKTYIDKTMLEGSIATADKIKSGNPFSLFLIVTEFYDVDLNINPSYSEIDQIYVLRKSKRINNNTNPIFSDVIIDLFNEVNKHIKKEWSDVKNNLEINGKIF